MAKLTVTVLAGLAVLGLAAANVDAKGPKPKMVVSPSMGVTGGTEVTVSGEHFVPNSSLFIVQCTKGIKGKKGASGEGYCNIGNIVSVEADGSGNVPATKFTLTAGAVGGNGTTCGTSKKDKICYVGLGDPEGDKNDSALGKITFAIP